MTLNDWVLSKVKLTKFVVAITLLYNGIVLVQYYAIHRVLIPNIGSKVLIVVALYFGLLRFFKNRQSIKRTIPTGLFMALVAWLGYSLISLVVAGFSGFSIKYLVTSASMMYFYPILVLVAYSFRPANLKTDSSRLDTKKVFNSLRNTLYVLAAIIWPLGFFQSWTNRPIIPVDLAGYYKLISFDFFGHMRATSFFGDGQAFGQFSVLVTLVALSSLLFDRWRVLDAVFLGLSIYASYLSLTRMVYIYSLFSVVTVLSVKVLGMMPVNRGAHGRRLLISSLPWIYATMIILALWKFKSIGGLSGGGLANGLSVSWRLSNWAQILNTYLAHGNLFFVLFGTGLIQSNTHALSNNILIDNTFIGIFILQGLIGLLLFLVFYVTSLTWLVRHTLVSRSYFEIAFLGNYSSFLAISFFNNLGFGSYYDFVILFLIVSLSTTTSRSSRQTIPQEQNPGCIPPWGIEVDA